MKYRNKHYFELGTLPFILFPVIGLTIALTLWISEPSPPMHIPYGYGTHLSSPHIDEDKLKYYADALNPDIDDCEKAVFDYTRDTVLVLTGPDFLKVAPGMRKVLYRTRQGILNTIDVPVTQLTEISVDSTDVEE